MTKQEIIKKLKWYGTFNGAYATTKRWKAGYFCALRDNGLIDDKLWLELLEDKGIFFHGKFK